VTATVYSPSLHAALPVCSGRLPAVDLAEHFHRLVRTLEDEDDLAHLLAHRDELFPAAGARSVAARKVAEEHSFDVRAQVLLDDVLARLRR